MLMGAMLLALLCLPVGQASAAKPGGKRKLPYSLTPSRTTPYTPCPPGGRMIECNMVIDPPAVKTPAGFEVPGVGLFEGGGPFGGYDPVDLRSAYGVPANGGVGQTVALIDAYGYANAEAELATYREFFGMEACTKANGCFKKVNEKGEEKNYPAEGGELEKSWQEETALDLDMVSAACPQCHILLVEATTQEAKDTGASASEAATLKATEISNSYGYPENNETFCPSKKGCKEYLADYNHSGIPVTVSSGDSGYDDGEAGAPSWPATSPNVIAVGGTTLRRALNARGWSESVWSATGSGCSLYESKPTWQTDTGCTTRMDNDVAAVANNTTPVAIYYSGWQNVGGTSVAAPLVAAIEAHANAATRTAGAEAFYTKPGMLFDITEGSNGTCPEHSYFCTAEAGYDGPTGEGTPNGVFHLSGWATQTVSNLAKQTNTETSGLSDVMCSGAESCFAVGHSKGHEGLDNPLAESWNGTAWSVQESPALRNAVLSGIACASATVCSAIGHTVESSGREEVYAAHWNGTVWVTNGHQLPNETKGATLTGISCIPNASLENCLGVGHYVSSSGVESVLWEREVGEFSTGASWTVFLTTNPTGAKSATLTGISCKFVSPNEGCMAVGHEVNSAGTEIPLAYFWSSATKKTTLESPIVPAGAKSSSFSAVSCVSLVSCTVAGHYVNSAGTEVTLAERWSSSKWTNLESPNPTGAKSSDPVGISCTAEEACEMVGHYVTSGGVESALAEVNSAKTWTVQEAPNPSGAKSSGLTGVWCTSSEACTAAGTYLNSASKETLFAERFGSTKKWALQEPVTPKLPSGNMARVSCTTSEACTSVGSALNSSGVSVTLAERWNGKEWARQETPNPTGSKGASLIAPSCASSTSCVAVGSYTNSSAIEVVMAEVWNGTTWSLKEPVTPTGAKSSKLVGVSCTSSTSCIAVGTYVNSSSVEVAFGESWNGTAWSLTAEMASPTGSKGTSARGVSCTSSTSCMATGRYINSAGNGVALAESWSGTAWTLKEAVVPTGSVKSSLVSVWCTSSTSCMAVGFSVNSSEKETAIAETWNGTAWTLKEPVLPTGAKSSILLAVSCTSSTSCTAVGDYFESSGAEVPLAEGWNGTAWTTQETPTPEGTGSWLSGVSCTSSSACIATGRSFDVDGLEVALAEEHS
jgi:Subtilase family